MSQFQVAKVRLTFWYTLTLMVVSLFLSTIYYQRTINQIEFQYRQIESRLNSGIGNGMPPSPQQMRNLPQKLEILEDDFELVRDFLFKQLLIINGMVLIVGSTVSYFLAGKTLKPIQESAEKQKQFIGDAAHELKTPLTALKTSLEVGLMDKKLSNSAAKLIKDSLEDVDSLTSLTGSLLSLARLERDDYAASFKIVDLKTIVNRTVKHLKPLANQKKIKITVSIPKDSTTPGDEDALLEAVMVILDNAIKYSQQKTEIKIKVEKQKNNLVLKIIDRGIGIETKHLSKIFDRFYRVDEARTKNSRHGYGLGLALAKKIFDQHGAKISVASELAKGSTFTIIF